MRIRETPDYSLPINTALNTPLPKLRAGSRADVTRQLLAAVGVVEPEFILPDILSVWSQILADDGVQLDDFQASMRGWIIAHVIRHCADLYAERMQRMVGERYHVPGLPDTPPIEETNHD